LQKRRPFFHLEISHIILYHCAGARSFRALWMLEELGLPYELRTLAFPPRAREVGYLALNPLGTIPLLIDGDTRMTESAAILQYLGTRGRQTDLVVGPHEQDYGAYLNFLVMGEATLTFPQTIFIRYTMMEPEERRLPQAAADYVQWFASRLRAAATLMGPEFACAGRFTAADISVGYALQLATRLGLADVFPPNVSDYCKRLRARPAYQRAQAAET
jgi:glutathione S-transferase